MKPFSDTTRAGVWLQAAQALREEEDRLYNLILEVKQPGLATPASRAIEARVDSFLRQKNCQPIHTVAETIFPATEYKRGGLSAVFDYPKSIYPLIKSVKANKWGTYALRLNERKCVDGSIFQPLKTVIDKLRKQLLRPGPQRAIYELDLSLEALELKLYDYEKDHSNPRGGQCLSHISLKLGPKRELYLTAIYRYQFFVQKALGNLLGLARLQDCIARELKIPVGPLVCHATLAVLEDDRFQAPWNARASAELVDECQALLSAPAAAVA